MTKLGRVIAGVLLLLAGAAAGWATHQILAKNPEAGGPAESDEAAPTVPPGEMSVKVKTALATTGDLPIVVDVVGVVRAAPSAECTISSRAFGRVSEMHVAAGQVVKKGDPVLSFEVAPLQAAVSEKQAALRLAENQLAEFEKVGRERQIVELQTAVKTATAEERLADAQVARLTPLAKEKLVADKALQEATQTAEKAKQDRERATHALSAFESVGADLQRANLEATRTAAAAALKDAEAVLADASVRAPSAGQIVSLTVRRGDRLEAGAPIGFLLCADARLVVFGVPPATAHALRTGAPASWLDAGGSPQTGTVDRIVLAVNATTGLMDVIVLPDAGAVGSPPGLIVKGEIEVERKKGAVIVPATAVVRSEDHQVVVIVGAGGQATITPVEILGRHGDQAAVLGTVKAGDKVIVDGGYNLPDKAHVVEAPETRPAETRHEGEGK